MKAVSVFKLIGYLALLFVVQNSNAFNLYPYKWPQASTTFYLDIPAYDNKNWNLAFAIAANEWAQTGFTFNLVREYHDPCNGPVNTFGFHSDGINGVKFSVDQCGYSFGSSTLAVTSSLFIGSEKTESDIIFNGNVSWDIYSGPRVYAYDFYRVALHELGHALGLDHENYQQSIMATTVNDIDSLQWDDYFAVHVLYSLPADTDQDGFSDAEEYAKGLNPLNPDSDNDGEIDGSDAFPLNPEPYDTSSGSFSEKLKLKGCSSLQSGGSLNVYDIENEFNMVLNSFELTGSIFPSKRKYVLILDSNSQGQLEDRLTNATGCDISIIGQKITVTPNKQGTVAKLDGKITVIAPVQIKGKVKNVKGTYILKGALNL